MDGGRVTADDERRTIDNSDLSNDGAEDELRYHDAPAELLALGSLGKGYLGITL